MAQNQHQHYSDLEVAPNQDPSSVAHTYQAGGVPEYSQYPEPVPTSEPAEKIATDKIIDPDSNGQKVYIPRENFAPEPVPPPAQGYQHPPNQYDAVPQSEAGAEASVGAAGAGAGAGARRTCGMKRRTFFIVLGLALLVIVGGIAGGVAGGVTARNAALRKGSSSDSSSSTNSSNVNVMSISTLSATNWTDGSNYVHRTVFFQDPWNSVLARRWDSQNQTWTTSNVTAVLANSPIPLNPQPGTSLAAAALDWPNAYRLQLYFLDPSNAVRSVFAGAPIVSPDLWQNDTLSDARLTTYQGSRLAAAWQRCASKNCVGVWAVAYQGPSAGAINVANYSDYASPTIMLDGNKVAGNSTLALVPQFQGTQERLGLLSQSYASGTSGTMQMNIFNETWNKSPNTIMSNIPLPASEQHSAVAKWGNWNRTLVMSLLDDQSMRGTWWDGGGSKTALDTITLDGTDAPSNPKFSAIAMTLDAHFYGIANDSVYEYTVDDTDPSTLHYVGQVYP